MLEILDKELSDGTRISGLVVLTFLIGATAGAYVVGQKAYWLGRNDVVRIEAPGCVVMDADGKQIAASRLRHGDVIQMPERATLSAACLDLGSSPAGAASARRADDARIASDPAPAAPISVARR